jgi:hypothetical protein
MGEMIQKVEKLSQNSEETKLREKTQGVPKPYT